MQSAELRPGVVSIKLDEPERSALQNEANDIRASIPRFTEATFLDELRQRGLILKARVGQVTDFLEGMSTHGGAKVAIFDLGPDSVKNIGPTPTEYKINEGNQNIYDPDIYRGLLVSLVDWYGYGYTTQQEGVIHNNIIPVEEYADAIGHSGNARYELGLHVEDASFNLGEGFDISPDFLTLHFFRNDKRVPTILAIPDWDQISPSTRNLLSEKWFFNQTNTMQGGARNNLGKPVSVIYGPNSDPWVRLNTSRLNLEAYEPDQVHALNEFTDHVNGQRVLVGAKAGEVVVFDNRRVLHGRAPYSEEDYPKYDGTDRWQRRLTVSCDMSRIKEFEASPRVVDPHKLLAKVTKLQ
ncbi:MAG: hypothetical protein A3C30_03380 [Candidatus Levybacteria bacterium RIFCSPHIGHO2_02_FULL_40_18]|nr:MAG: hypothetical protein A2869_01860 [Candidatus Levybacteria bacterium RIFCSPHIGHO2_01_FULL_40_58]OGH26132.1 MAG: hypothetical protein A3C30_03380 [Candidatus Levybacteria bacterium RIFCSPHIGHO2_02_FULL_40_18]OGH31320.1 MAG: hypothetical protein A3E43_03125 [Candidatus Levybacteria bacterium RIFCSPHIGHO2_12_FULL_40_31]OGH39961.1 MAG: hypothetical protein A2894_02730 [Candidatus Levybacteria bacterium RIFCSPLOWO2_01_FULL_40_64]OGH49607.1 MAG: hypothetical protein A3I54_05165 [Candidatus Lev